MASRVLDGCDYSRQGYRQRHHTRNHDREYGHVAENGRDQIQVNPAHPLVAVDQLLPVNADEQPAAVQGQGGIQQQLVGRPKIGDGLDGQQGPAVAQLNRMSLVGRRLVRKGKNGESW
ncbi:hypothetical protein OUZ56_003623 [Daphnia magna]|uniref:Uncharacterized protein n=1 Tax=Daphnia magna TaxID=35525 RepID=A0ABR0A9N3_9CRUS|nr:hypothetical protein OUZ56_003623 [Daphnia magna]